MKKTVITWLLVLVVCAIQLSITYLVREGVLGDVAFYSMTGFIIALVALLHKRTNKQN
ncbi:hypothetical protein AB6M97_08500 [Streptococcus hillyeri]|uniref:hypothetical protein n=1 Tax=Streptococcus hillyeri TaxID=2282420 RepID=UPI0016052B6E|nr:hypothetical protein [Streptococcus hillyeri]